MATYMTNFTYTLILAVLIILLSSHLSVCQTSYGTSFAFAFPPAREDTTDGFCSVYVNAKDTADVRISWLGSSYTATAEPGQAVRFDAPCTDRTRAGIEDKVYYVTSSSDVSVMLSNNGGNDHMDSTLVTPLSFESDGFYIMVYTKLDEDNYGCGQQLSPASFYTISATQDATTIDIFVPDRVGNYNMLESFTLDQFQSYTNTTRRESRGFDFTGFYVSANQPISVSSGSLCTEATKSSDNFAGVTWSFMPPESSLNGGLHISYQITPYSGDAIIPDYYLVMVLAIENDTVVSFAGIEYAIPYRGTYREYEFFQTWESIICDQPCLVMQINKNFEENTGIFMLQIPPVNYYSNYVTFSAAQGTSSTAHYVRVVTRSAEQNTIVFENVDVVEDWLCRNLAQGFGCHMLGVISDIDSQARIFNSEASNGVTFSAVVYVSGYTSKGYGYSTGILASTYRSHLNFTEILE